MGLRAFWKRLPIDRRVLYYYFGFLSAIWLVGISANGIGYWIRLSEIGGHVSLLEWSYYGSILLVPLLIFWLPLVFTHRWRMRQHLFFEERSQSEAMLGHESLSNIYKHIDKISKKEPNIAYSLNVLLQAKRPTNISQEIGSKAAINDHSYPKENHLPLNDQPVSPEIITLGDVARALDFSDSNREGDWARALGKVVQRSGNYELLKSAESVLNAFELDGIRVENIAITIPAARSWRAFLLGQREGVVKELATIKDQNLISKVRKRMKKDELFRNASLNFQRYFIAMVERHIDLATEDELDRLATCRGGRAFSLLGTASNLFSAKAL